MTFKTFEELDAEAGPAALFTDYAKKPPASPLAGYDTPDTLAKAEEIAQRSTVAAAFRSGNTIGSILSRKDTGIDNNDDGQFDPVAYVKEHNLQGYEDSFMGVLNGRRADAVRSQIQMEERDRETLAAAGWAGTFAQIAAGVFDAPTLIPGSVAVRGVKGGWSIGRSVLMAGTSAAATQAVTEGFLQASQETRTAGESAINIGAAAVLGSLLGGGVAAVLGKNERIAMTKALENVSDIQSGAKPNEFVPAHILDERAPVGGGADVAEGAFYVDPIQKSRTRGELAVEGAAASAVVEKTSFFNPVLRATQRYAASARQVGNVIYENTIYRAMHSAGDTTGVSVEAAVRTRVTGLQAEAASAAQAAYEELRSGKLRMSEDDFYGAVGRAMRNNDEDANPFVARAAQGYRKLFDEFTNEALKLGLLKEGDLDVKTAASYFSRVYNRDKLLASEPDFLNVIGKHFADRMSGAYELDVAAFRASEAKYKLRLEDTGLTGPERANRIGEIDAAGKANDEANPHLVDLASDLKAARDRVTGATDDTAKAAARAEVKQIMDSGGADFEKYLATRAEHRRRMRDLTAANPDAQLARGEKLGQKIDAAEEQVGTSLAVFGRRTKNLLDRLQRDPVGTAKEAADSVRDQLTKLREQTAKTAERASKLGAQYIDEMNPQRAFQEGVSKAEARGAAGDKAIQAGTREADRVTKQIDQSKAAITQYERQLEKLETLADRMAQRETAVDAARQFAAEVEATVKLVNEQTAARSIRRGEAIGKLKERAAKLAPDEVKTRAAAQASSFKRIADAAANRFDSKWEKRLALGRERGEGYNFEAAGREAASEIYGKITGNTQHKEDLPAFITKITSGPMKERTFMVPDELLQGKGWLKDDVREVANRYSRSMAGEIELTRRFGRADMADQLGQIGKEYSDMRVAADKATSVDELNKVLGRDKYGAKADLAEAKLDAQKVLSADEHSAVTDTKAGRDMIRGTYNQGDNNSNFASISRSLMGLNYITKLGGVLLANLTEFYRPAMVHGIMPYLGTVPEAMAQAFNKGSEGFKMSLHEAKLAGLVRERVMHSIMASNGDVADPFVTRATQLERFMQKASGLASRWNLIDKFTDAQQTIASAMSQHRVLEAVLGNGGKDGSFTKGGDGIRLIRMLGMDERTQGDVARLFGKYGETVDGIRVANTERWLTEGGDAASIARNENAVRVYRAVINTDVNSIISRKGLGDAPLMSLTPLGKMMTQFSGYAMGAHSRVMIRGLQESHARLIGGLTAMAIMGAGTAYLSSLRSGRESHDKRMADWTRNPMLLVGEGLDRSGFFPILFDLANRTERVSGAAGYDYRFNPVKSPIAMLGGKGGVGITSTRASDSAAAFGAVLGPSAGMIDSAIAVGRVVGDKATGKTPPKRDVNQAIAILPGQSYYGMREFLQVLTGNSNYTRR